MYVERVKTVETRIKVHDKHAVDCVPGCFRSLRVCDDSCVSERGVVTTCIVLATNIHSRVVVNDCTVIWMWMWACKSVSIERGCVKYPDAYRSGLHTREARTCFLSTQQGFFLFLFVTPLSVACVNCRVVCSEYVDVSRTYLFPYLLSICMYVHAFVQRDVYTYLSVRLYTSTYIYLSMYIYVYIYIYT